MKKSVKILLLGLLSLSLTTLSGCGQSNPSSEVEKHITNISIKTSPTKTEYEVGEEIDLSGLVIEVSYSDGSKTEITGNDVQVRGDTSSSGTKTITLIYQDFEVTFNITVKDSTTLTFTITYDPNAGEDTVTGMPNNETVEEGNHSLSKLIPQRGGYEFVGWSTSSNGEVITSINVTEDMTIYAIWEVEVAKVNVKGVDVPNANYVTTDIKAGDKFKPGEKVKANITGGMQFINQFGGYIEDNLGKVNFVVDGFTYHPTSLPIMEEGQEVDHFEVEFVVPNNDFVIFVFYSTNAKQEDGYTISLSSDSTPGIKILGYEEGETYSQFTSGYLLLPDNYLIDSAEYSVDDGSTWTNYTFNRRTNMVGNYYTLSMQSGRTPIKENIILKIIASEHHLYLINYEVDSDITLSSSSLLPSSSYDGLNVYFSVYVSGNTLFTVSSTDCDLNDQGYGSYDFTMPNHDVTIYIYEKEADCSLSIVNNDSSILEAFFLKENDYFGGLSHIEKGVSGTTIYAFLEIEGNNKKPTGGSFKETSITWKYQGLGNHEDKTTRIYSAAINIPEGETSLEVTPVISNAYEVLIDENLADDVVIGINGNNPIFVKEETVVITFDVEVYNLIVMDTNRNVIEVTLSDYLSGRGSNKKVIGKSFLMPENNVIVSLEKIA
ncbi:MAG: bacterial Ig-like domain-containing protein [Bacilli bacterium]|nr:bacterial Ig-like domain-containing protein [Bacilli bacterium]